ncbi:acyl-phosphate glycerol 3-phosphate acyltransferase [Candidatus Fermentibacteria bacterium]|nr:MAG: acyl-phosphate glycerol 3-phosphate acyltransferase [Candidatus Fermentibacteria bacterium]
MSLWPDVLYITAAFLSGSVPWSWILGKFRGIDIRSKGSGNTGATNLFRICGKGAGITGLLLDTLKGALPVLAAKHGIPGILPPIGDWALALTAIFAVLGHVFCPWLGFRGGKGVATTLGVLLILSPLTTASALAVFVLVLSVTRYVSLGSISAAAAVIPFVFIFEPGRLPIQIIICFVAALVIVRHKSNIVKLLHGEESRFSFHGGNK